MLVQIVVSDPDVSKWLIVTWRGEQGLLSGLGSRWLGGPCWLCGLGSGWGGPHRGLAGGGRCLGHMACSDDRHCGGGGDRGGGGHQGCSASHAS